MSSLKFETLNEDVEDLLDKVSKRLEVGISKTAGAEERKRIIHSLEISLDEAKSHLNKMEIECLSAPSKYQPIMHSKINKYNSEILRHRSRLIGERYALTIGPQQYTSVTDNSSHNIDAQIRQQVLMGTSALERTAESLERSHIVAVEAEQIGTEVLGELGTQREALERARDRLGDTQEEISRSKRALRAMGRNVVYNKILLIVIIMLEVLILGGLVYWKFFT